MNKFFKVIKDNLDILFFFLLMLFKLSLLSYFLQNNYTAYHTFYPSAIGSLLILIALGLLFKKRGRMRYFYTLNIIITIFIVSDMVYFRYFKDMISFFVLVNGFQLGDVKSSVFNIIKITDFLFFIDLIPLFFLKKLYKNEPHSKALGKRTFALCAVILFIGLGTEIINFYAISKEQPKLLTNMYNKAYIAKSLSDLNYHAVDIYNFSSNFIVKSIPLNAHEKSTVYAYIDKNKSEQDALFGKYKGKNLIMIQVEALQGFTINSKVNGKEVTPNLNNFIKGSLYFPNIYYQIASGGTSDAEFMTNNSLYPASSGAAYFLYSGNTYNSLAKRLESTGYETSVLHGFRENFWNRQVMYKAESFQNFYGEKSFNINEIVGLGLSDKSFFSQSIEKMKTFKKPYYSFLITLSSHYPFDDTKNYGDFDTGKYENTFMGNYLKAAHYADAQLGSFLDDLNKEGLLKDSIVVIYGDHNAIQSNNSDNLCKFLNLESNELNFNMQQKIPLIIHLPNSEVAGTNTIIGGQMDVMPTLLNLLGLSSKDTFGKDLLNSEKGYALFRNGSYIDDEYFYLSQSDALYNLKSKKEVKDTTVMEKIKDKMKELQYSDDILTHNLLKDSK